MNDLDIMSAKKQIRLLRERGIELPAKESPEELALVKRWRLMCDKEFKKNVPWVKLNRPKGWYDKPVIGVERWTMRLDILNDKFNV